ncbi:hypothetical protein HK101_002953 [Irineochytrium annulatum]|nr:hypothetical protein HK101_002953 [Irineochytrium annulatum]
MAPTYRRDGGSHPSAQMPRMDDNVMVGGVAPSIPTPDSSTAASATGMDWSGGNTTGAAMGAVAHAGVTEENHGCMIMPYDIDMFRLGGALGDGVGGSGQDASGDTAVPGRTLSSSSSSSSSVSSLMSPAIPPEAPSRLGGLAGHPGAARVGDAVGRSKRRRAEDEDESQVVISAGSGDMEAPRKASNLSMKDAVIRDLLRPEVDIFQKLSMVMGGKRPVLRRGAPTD